ncbi:hypothetical protein HH310_31625 [Actinoplanes sp. TBRC 11911]|uniref:hypothetical protein n=1 Tax=Actinoplanes sp. TBRC 11911 TaxID=2729386 RepID=UPI00145E32B0|nr:hypothetical protein [Actinoplanes sp. TBRC 11911]NMO55720.1 hypothetical protein [Actinoplanes sp. TBRC 11911]
MKIEFDDGKFNLALTREELVVLICALGWTDSLVPSDLAFQEYVGLSREGYRSLMDAMADAVRSSSAQDD